MPEALMPLALAAEVEEALARNGWSTDDIRFFASGEVAAGVLRFLHEQRDALFPGANTESLMGRPIEEIFTAETCTKLGYSQKWRTSFLNALDKERFSQEGFKIFTLGDLLRCTPAELAQIPGIGMKGARMALETAKLLSLPVKPAP